MSEDEWPSMVYDEELERQRPEGLKAFSIRTATEKQEEAIRGLATEAGFKDLRGFWKWVQSADLTYYDLIKVASPE